MMNWLSKKKRWWLIAGIGVLLVFFAYKYFTDWWWTVPSNSEVIISLARTGCFGSCPVYKLTMYDNGTTIYEGFIYVGARGIRKANIGADAVQQLALELDSAGYFLLQDSYNEQMYTDASSVITYVKIGDRKKQIEHYGGDPNAPEELYRLEKLIDDTANTRRWVRACSFWYPNYCGFNPVFWIMATMPLTMAGSITSSFIKRGRARTGIILGGAMIVVIWILVILLTNRHDLFGMRSTVGFYGIVGFSEFVAVVLLGWFLVKKHKENPIQENTG